MTIRARHAILALSLLALAGCKRKGYPVRANLDTSDPDILRVHVSTTEEATVSILGTTQRGSSRYYSGASTFIISTAQFPPGTHTIHVTAVVGEGKSARRGSTDIEYTRPAVSPWLKVGSTSYGYGTDSIKCTGAACAGTFPPPKDGLLSVPVEAPPGCTVEMLGETHRIPVPYPKFKSDDVGFETEPSSSHKDQLVLKLDVKERTLDAQLPDAIDKEKAPPLAITAKVTCDDQSTEASFSILSGDLMGPAISRLFASVKTAGVSFGAGDGPPKAPRSIVVIEVTGDSAVAGDYVGKPGRVRDVDLVAFTEYKSRSGGSCGPYETYASEQFYAPLTLNDRAITVYDRRTGRVVKQQTLPAYGSCPEYLTATSYGGGSASASVSGGVTSSRVTDFLKALIK